MTRVVGRAVMGIAAGALVLSPGATSALAAPPMTYEAVAGNFASPSSASPLAAKLTKAGRKGYKIERSFPTKAAAQAEVTKLKAAKYHGALETDAPGSV